MKSEKIKKIQNIGAILFSVLILLGVLICATVEIAVSGALPTVGDSWSLIAISSQVFAWLVFIPTIKYGFKGIVISLASLSVFVIPFLFSLSLLVDSGGLILPIGIRVSIVSIIYIWIVFAMSKIMKTRKLIAFAISLLLAIPLNLTINFVLAEFTHEPIIEVWSFLSYITIIVLAVVLLILNGLLRNRKGTQC